MTTTEPMSMSEILYWINFSVKEQARTWLSDSMDQSLYEAQAKKDVPHSDVYAARNLYTCFKSRVTYIPGSNAWHVWNGVYHEKVDGDLLADWMCGAFLDAHRDALSEVKDRYYIAASALTGTQADAKKKAYATVDFKEHRAYRDKIHSSSGYKGLVSQIKMEFSVVDSFFNNDRDWLVLNNGVVDLNELRENPPIPGDLSSIKLLEHDPARPVYRCVTAALNPRADAPRWRGFLSTSVPSGDLRKFLAVVSGASLLAESKTKTIPVLLGGKDSGKTIFIDTICNLAGGYGGQPANSALNISNAQNFEQDQFRGLRFVGITEPNTDRKVDEPFIKQFTGGDIISTRNLHSKSVPWKSQGILFIATNNDLKFNTGDKAILERFATVLFPHRFYPQGQVPVGKEEYVHDKTLEADLKTEQEGILNWVLNGMLVYLNEGIVIPEEVTRERSRMYVEGSSVHTWIEDVVKPCEASFLFDVDSGELAPNQYAALSDVFLEYTSWCSIENGETPLTLKKFSRQLQDYLGVTLVKSSSMRVPLLVPKDVHMAWKFQGSNAP